MHYRLAPPTKGFQSFEMVREAGSDEVTLRVVQNSYLLTYAELAEWLVRVGCHQPTRIADWAWNYRRVIYDLVDHVMTVPDDQQDDSNIADIADLAAITLGNRIPLDSLGGRSIFDDPDVRSNQSGPAYRFRS